MKLYAIIACAFFAASVTAERNSGVHLLNQGYAKNDDGSYHFNYELSDGTKRSESGSFEHDGNNEGLVVNGHYEYLGDDGNTYRLDYQANRDGFQPIADHLPVAPAQLPEYEQWRQEHPELFL